MIKKLLGKLGNFIEKAENTDLSFWRGAFLLFILMFFRTFLENYANSANLYHMSGIIDTFFTYPLWFSIIFLSIIIVARILTKEKIEKVGKFVALCSFGIVIPPIVDLIVNKTHQIPYVFISGNYSELFKSFFTYFGGGLVGTGIKTEIVVALTGLGIYIFLKTKKIKKSVLGILILYVIVFMMSAIPTLIFDIQNKITHEYPTVNESNIVDFWYNKEPTDSVTSNRTFILEHNDYIQPNNYTPFELHILNQNSLTLSIVFLIINVILLFWCLFLYSSKKFFAVLKNFRYVRIIHGFILISLGIYLGSGILEKNPVASLFDLVSFVSLFLSFLFAWLFAVWENDEVDIKIDQISNQSRPLAQPEPVISRKEWTNLKYLFLFCSLSFAFLDGLYSFIFILLFIFIYHIYSTYPFRFKRFLGISSLLVALNMLILIWMGFFLVIGTENLSTFRIKDSFMILVIFLLVENGKNIKDIEGDRKEGIKTLPVILGEKKGKIVVGCLLFLGSLLVPFIFYLNLHTLLLAIFFGLIFFFLTVRKNYVEKYLFITYFLYALTFFVFINW